MVKLVNPLHPKKAKSPIEVTLEGMIKLANVKQPLKASLPIEVTPKGIVKLVNPLQPSYLLLVDYQYYTL